MKKLLLWFIFCAFFLLGFGCATPEVAPKPAIRYRPGREFLALPLKFTATKTNLTVSTADGKTLKLTPGSDVFFFEECKICLPERITLAADGVYHAGPRTLLLLNALTHYPKGRHFGRRILVDPGHGGHDQGAKGKKLLEKDLNLALAKAITTTLCERGFFAELSREDDRFYTLAERVRIAEKYDILISVHHNGSTQAKASGLETFAPETPRAQQMESVILAFMVQRNMVRATHEIDRGVKTGKLYVLEHTKIPAILLEAGFITNPSDEKKLDDPVRRQKIADAVADALVSFYRSTAPKAKPAKKR